MNSQGELIYTYSSCLNPYDVDMHRKATLTGINQLADRAAFDHIRKLGFSTEFMLDQNLAWILYQKDISIAKDLVLGKEYRIKSIIAGRDSLFAYRDFIILDPEGQVCIEISSAWLLFDLLKRSMLRQYPDVIEDLIKRGNQLQSLARPHKLKAPRFKQADFQSTHRVNYMDLDANKHISNQSLIRKLSELLPYDLMEEKRISAARLQFKSEAFLGDVLGFQAKLHDNDIVELICASQSKTIVFGLFEFEKRF